MRVSLPLCLAFVLSFAAGCSPPVDTNDAGADTRTGDALTADNGSIADVLDARADATVPPDVAADQLVPADTTSNDVARDIATDTSRDVPDVSASDVAMSDVRTDGSIGDVATADVPAADACNRPAINPSAIGNTCGAGAACPASYTCQAFSGIVLTHSCQILCTTDCDCPDGSTCEERSDKGSTWHQCSRP